MGADCLGRVFVDLRFLGIDRLSAGNDVGLFLRSQCADAPQPVGLGHRGVEALLCGEQRVVLGKQPVLGAVFGVQRNRDIAAHLRLAARARAGGYAGDAIDALLDADLRCRLDPLAETAGLLVGHLESPRSPFVTRCEALAGTVAGAADLFQRLLDRLIAGDAKTISDAIPFHSSPPLSSGQSSLVAPSANRRISAASTSGRTAPSISMSLPRAAPS